MSGAGVSRDHYPSGDVPFERYRLGRFRIPIGLNHGLGVADAGCQTQHDGEMPAFGKFEGFKGESVRFLRIGRLEHGDARSLCIVAVVLLVLAEGHAGIIGGNQNQPAGNAGVGRSEERIGSHIDADVFHGHQRPRARIGRAEPDFQSDLLVRSPLRSPAIRGEVFQYFGGGSARVPSPQGYARMFGGQGHRFVSAEQKF